jgi:hypothetical protein
LRATRALSVGAGSAGDRSGPAAHPPARARHGRRLRLDVIHAPPLLDDLPATFDKLRRALTEADKGRFHKLRQRADTELEVAIPSERHWAEWSAFARVMREATELARSLPGVAVLFDA